MKSVKILLVSFLVAFVYIGCSGGSSSGQGGPGESPQDQTTSGSVATGINTSIPADADSTGAAASAPAAVTGGATTGAVSVETPYGTQQTTTVAAATTESGATTSGSTTAAPGSSQQETGTEQIFSAPGGTGTPATQTSTASSAGETPTGTPASSSNEGQTGSSSTTTSTATTTTSGSSTAATSLPVESPETTLESDLADNGDFEEDVVDQVANPPQCSQRSVTLDSSSGRWYVTTEKQAQGQGKNRTTVDVPVGIHTYWANEDLFLDVKNNCKAGWYRLRMEARNYDGKLPDFYSHFAVMVKNQRTDKWVGGLLIKASDNNYQTGSMLVYLPEGNTRLNLLWNNDAYESGTYDANIDIKDVTINYSIMQQPQGSLVRRANQFSELNGRFFWDRNSVYTYWANQTIGFEFPNLQPGLYQVRVVAKNRGTLPPNYRNFDVEVDTNNGTSGVMQIPADERHYRAGTVNLDLTGGDTTIYLNWTNDQYAANQYDANIQIKTIRLIRIGDSQRSALAAYLIAKARSNKGIIMILGGMVIVLSGLFVWNRKRMKAGASY